MEGNELRPVGRRPHNRFHVLFGQLGRRDLKIIERFVPRVGDFLVTLWEL